MGVTTTVEFRPSDAGLPAIIIDGAPTNKSEKYEEDAGYHSGNGYELLREGIVASAPTVFEVHGAIRREYIVRDTRTNAYVDQFFVDVPTIFYIDAEIHYQVWIDQGISGKEKKRLEILLSEFLGGPLLEPEKFAIEKEVDFSVFSAEPYFVFSKSNSPPKSLDSYEKDLLSSAQQTEEFWVQLVGESIVLGDVNSEMVGFDENDPDALEDYLNKEYEKSGCAEYPLEVQEHHVSNIIDYTEFKTIIAYKWLEIGCVKTKIYYPKVLSRGARRVAVVQVLLPQSLKDSLKTILSQCGERAAKASLVTAFVAWVTDESMEKALVAFKAVFYECIEEKINTLIECVVPKIILKKELLSDWKDAF